MAVSSSHLCSCNETWVDNVQPSQHWISLCSSHCSTGWPCLCLITTLLMISKIMIINNKHYTPSRTLRSSDYKLLFVPRVRTCFGSRSFAVSTPTIWNSLPLAIRSSGSTYSFRRQLKSFFYNLSFRPS